MTYFTDLGLTPLTDDITVEMVINDSVVTMQVQGLDAPVTAANFVDLVERGIYNATKFHRLEPGFVAQGGDPQSKDPTVSEELLGTGGFIDPATDKERNIPLEIKPVGADEPIYSKTFAEAEITAEPFLPHVKGAIAMARTNDPDTASSQFYFALDDLPQLDGSYAVFGGVTKGMDVVENIAKGDAIQFIAVTNGNVASRQSSLVKDFDLLNSFINDTNTTKIEYTVAMPKTGGIQDNTTDVENLSNTIDPSNTTIANKTEAILNDQNNQSPTDLTENTQDSNTSTDSTATDNTKNELTDNTSTDSTAIDNTKNELTDNTSTDSTATDNTKNELADNTSTDSTATDNTKNELTDNTSTDTTATDNTKNKPELRSAINPETKTTNDNQDQGTDSNSITAQLSPEDQAFVNTLLGKTAEDTNNSGTREASSHDSTNTTDTTTDTTNTINNPITTRTAAIMALGGNDQIRGTNDNNVINGNEGDDDILGADGHDFLRGGKGNDQISGGLGNDFLLGDYGIDTLTGNEGIDNFVLRASTEKGVTSQDLADVIADFSVTDGDRIAVIADFITEADLVYETSGNDTILKLGTTGDILALVKGVTQSMIEQNISIIGTDDIAMTRIG